LVIFMIINIAEIPKKSREFYIFHVKNFLVKAGTEKIFRKKF